MAPTWKIDAAGRRVVEPKDETRKKIGRSPDDADAMNLAYHDPWPSVPDPELVDAFGKALGSKSTKQPGIAPDDPLHPDWEQNQGYYPGGRANWHRHDPFRR
jgi:hypothetical protein